ncbi:hypothetical protein [Streptomyces mexicanus]|uniref:hypothetical protein n=1 Tax=Streptomyces mexicanus TaxID=178566 RepID=UPI00135B8B36|nr:hypothetical protein [Streptomyces mexicanus]
MTQELAVEVLKDPSQGFTGIPPQRQAPRTPAQDEPRDLKLKLYSSDNELWIHAIVPDQASETGSWHQAPLEVSPEELLDRAARLRALWRDQIVHHQSTALGPGRRVGGYPLAETADLSELRAVTEPLVAKLAAEGHDLLYVLLDGTGYNLGRFREVLLDALSSDRPLRISIDSPWHLPWPMLAVDPADCADPWEAFWGYRHQVEQASPDYPWDQAPLGHRELATTSLNKDTALDHVGRAQDVHELLDQRSRLIVRTHSEDLLDALSCSVLHEDVMYFWCHGHYVHSGPSNQCLAIRLSDSENIDGPVVRRTRRRYDHRTPQARFKPFVLLNACHTAQAAPPGRLKHLGQELIALGAAGVLAPQIEIPQVFATEYAYAFLDHYLTGKYTAGEVSQLLVRQFAQDFHNPLALTYSLHAGMNSRLDLAS